MDDSTIDQLVGGAIKAQRVAAGQTQDTLAQAVGVTFQQLQKYERGANRVSASKLWRMARALDCSPALFFAPVYSRALAETLTEKV